ncbi:YkvA family protein, partial [Rhizobium leguminosarum]|uniref:YkvA family protein n=1 Tax=Rhizobium leguminosarum TaxID=384 RepID=UPI003F94D9AE
MCRTARRNVGQNFCLTVFSRDVVAGFYCALDPQTPTKVRGVMLAALAYFVMPIDMITDIFAVIGFSDDIAVLSA